MMNKSKIKAYNLIDTLPDDKMEKVLAILEDLKDIITDNAPDKWDLELLKEAQVNKKNGDFSSLDDLTKELGFDAIIEDGLIRVPNQYMRNLGSDVKVIILTEGDKRAVKKQFSAIKLKTKNFTFDREMANER
jgi:hypothetical protein